MIKTLSLILCLPCFVSYGQVRVASSTKTTDPIVYKTIDADSKVKKSLDSLAAVLRKELRDSFATVLPIDNYTIVKNAKGQGGVQSKWVDSVAKKAVDLTATNARIDSTIKAFKKADSTLNTNVWLTIKSFGISRDRLIKAIALKNGDYDKAIKNLTDSGALTDSDVADLKAWGNKVDAALRKPILQ